MCGGGQSPGHGPTWCGCQGEVPAIFPPGFGQKPQLTSLSHPPPYPLEPSTCLWTWLLWATHCWGREGWLGKEELPKGSGAARPWLHPTAALPRCLGYFLLGLKGTPLPHLLWSTNITWVRSGCLVLGLWPGRGAKVRYGRGLITHLV